MRTTWLVFILSLALAVSVSRPTITYGDTVAAGTNYFQTLPGTLINLGPGIGLVNFTGVPIGPGLTDTIVQRQADATIGGAAVTIQLAALSLQSTAPVNIGGNSFNVFVTLDPAHLALDTGTILISGTTAAGGMFIVSLTEFWDVHFTPVGAGTLPDMFTSATLLGEGQWVPTPLPGTLLVSGLPGDQGANFHTGLPGGTVDFFVGNPLLSNTLVGFTLTGVPGSVTVSHVVGDTPAVPEPSSLLLLGSGLAGLAAWRRRMAA